MLLFLFLIASSLGGAFAVRDSRRMHPVVPAALSRKVAVFLAKKNTNSAIRPEPAPESRSLGAGAAFQSSCNSKCL